MNPYKFDVDVIVVGAGIAGLSAAFAIHEREPTLTILVLEANEKCSVRVGGRTLSASLKTDDGSETAFDIGGHFLSKLQTHLMSLLAKLELPIVKNVCAPNKYTIGDFDDRIMLSTDDPPMFGTITETQEIIKCLAKLERLSKNISLEDPMCLMESAMFDKMTIEAFIYQNLHSDFSRSFLTTILRSQFGVEPSEVSVLFFLSYCNSTQGISLPYTRTNGGGKEFWVKGGAVQICEKIASVIGEKNIKINSAVTKISRLPTGSLVYTAEEMYSCRFTIVAISPPHLTDIIFNPPLSETRMRVLQNMREKDIVHFVVTYKTEFWVEDNYSGEIFCNANDPESFPIIYCYNVISDGHPGLAGLLEPNTLRTKKNHKTEVLNHLAKYFGEEALAPVQYIERNWSQYFFNRFVSYPAPKMMKHFHELRKPIGRLFFAGAETSTYWYGHMNGAVHSGNRAAIELLYDLRPQSLTVQDFVDLKPKRQMVIKYDNRSQSTYRDWILMIFITAVVAYLVIKIITTAETLTNKIFPL